MQSGGVRGLASALYRRISPPRFSYFPACAALFHGKVGLEIGGPSPIFADRGAVPVYRLAYRIDNCNFSSQTVWEGQVVEGQTFRFSKRRPPGRQYIGEARHLPQFADASYDFILSSHCLEHLADPLGGLAEWTRILKPQGVLALVVPHKDATFDHQRPVTSLAHLLQDQAGHVGEDDLTHLDEVLALTDLALAPGVSDRDTFEERSRHNLENRCLHHHVFDMPLVLDVIEQAGLNLIAVEAVVPCHIVAVAQKPVPGRSLHRRSPTIDLALRRSPFPSDHID